MTLYRVINNDLILISYLSDAIPGLYSNDVALTGGADVNDVFLYAYVGGQIFKSINGGSTWAHKGAAPSSWWWINGFNASNL